MVLNMKNNLLGLKGIKEGFLITLPEGTELQRLLDDLNKKMASAAPLFKGSVIYVESDKRNTNEDEKKAIRTVLVEQYECREIVFVENYAKSYFKTAQEMTEFNPNEGKGPMEDALLVRRTLRSGQKVASPNNLVVFGDVNPGAEVVAAGDIIVFGYLRGVVHAGSGGSSKALVAAMQLQPTQLRIGPFIARSQASMIKSDINPEMARVVDNEIVIEKFLFSNVKK